MSSEHRILSKIPLYTNIYNLNYVTLQVALSSNGHLQN